MTGADLAVLVGAGAMGSIPFGWLIARASRGIDLRREGSLSSGATNVLRTSGLAPAAATLALDMAKGAAAARLAETLGSGSAWVAPSAAVAAVTGHALSPWLGFRGGRGVAPAAGAMLVLAPRSALIAIGVFLGILALWRWVSVASLSAATAFPVAAALQPEAGSTILAGVIVAGIIVWRHRDNVARLREGREPRLRVRGRVP